MNKKHNKTWLIWHVWQSDETKIGYRWMKSKSSWQPMDSFRIEFARSASKDLRAIDRKMVPKNITAIEELANDPTPIGCKKLAGSDHTYRIRVGDYRVIYDIHGDKLLVSVIGQLSPRLTPERPSPPWCRFS